MFERITFDPHIMGLTIDHHEPDNSPGGRGMSLHQVRLLFVCIGNTCRSPMAVGVAHAVFGPRVYAESAGITATGRSATPEAVAVMQERFSITLAAHRSRHIAAVVLAHYDFLIALDPVVYAPLRERCPEPPPQVLYWPIADPYLEGLDAYRQCVQQLEACLNAHAPQLLGSSWAQG